MVWSPSMRRVWIEICSTMHKIHAKESPSMRRVWIEIFLIQTKSHK